MIPTPPNDCMGWFDGFDLFYFKYWSMKKEILYFCSPAETESGTHHSYKSPIQGVR